MSKKIDTIISWGVDNIYTAVMAGKITTLNGVIKIMQAIAPLKETCPRTVETVEEIKITLPEGEGGA